MDVFLVPNHCLKYVLNVDICQAFMTCIWYSTKMMFDDDSAECASWKRHPWVNVYTQGRHTCCFLLWAKKILQIFEIYDVSNNWNVGDMTVQITWSTPFLKSDHEVIDTYIVFFLYPFLANLHDSEIMNDTHL